VIQYPFPGATQIQSPTYIQPQITAAPVYQTAAPQPASHPILVNFLNVRSMPPTSHIRVGVLLPITSRGSRSGELVYNINRFVKSLHDTTTQHRDKVRHELITLIAVDYDDQLLVNPTAAASINKHSKQALVAAVESNGTLLLNTIVSTFAKHHLPVPRVYITTPHIPSGAICQIWRELALLAVHGFQCHYFVLLGDDVELLTPR
jgi:hypothetical protein